MLVMGEVALTLTVVCGATLLVKSALRLQAQDPGFKPAGVLSFRIGIPETAYSNERAQLFFETLEARLRALPGVTSVAYSLGLPPNMLDVREQLHDRGQRPAALAGPDGVAEWNSVSTGYFETLGIRVLEGRAFTTADTARCTLGRAGESVVRAKTLPRTKRHRQTPEGRRLGRAGTVDNDRGRGRRRAVHERRLGRIAPDVLRGDQPESVAAVGPRRYQDARRSRTARRRQHGVKRVHSMPAFRCATWRR